VIILPSPRIAYLRSFSLALTLLHLCIACILAYSLPVQPALFVFLFLLVGFPLIGILQPAWMKAAYTAWNSGAGLFARAARVILTGICFYIIFLAVGRAGSRMDLHPPKREKSLWNPKGTLPGAAFDREFAAVESSGAAKGWIRGYSFWARNSGQIWALFLLPFLVMLSALDSHRDSRLPDGVYTLF
jgi:hypothetical protein